MKWRSKEPSAQPGADLSGACEAVRRLVEEGDLGDAITQLQTVAQAGNPDPEISRGLSALKGRLSDAESDELEGKKTSAEATVERNQIRRRLLVYVEKVKEGPAGQVADRLFSKKELEARRDYLQSFKEDIADRLKVSIYNAHRIDLGLADTPSAVRPPWGFRDTSTSQPFGSFDEAIETHKRRVLVLGAPGSGKSITLLQFAEKLIAEAEADVSAPIPMWVNLSKFEIKSSSQPARFLAKRSQPEPADEGTRIERWLQKELAANPFVSPDIAGRWISEGRIGSANGRPG